MSSSSARPTPAPWSLDELPDEPVFPHVADAVAAAAPSASPEMQQACLDAEAAGYARGRADGRREAQQAAQQAAHTQVVQAIAALEAAQASIRSHEQRWLVNVEENVAALAVSVARHILDAELHIAPEQVAALVARALIQFPLDRELVVRLHPDDFAVVTQQLAATSTVPGREIRWQADANILPGGCMVEGRERVLDGRLDTALERAYRAIAQVQA